MVLRTLRPFGERAGSGPRAGFVAAVRALRGDARVALVLIGLESGRDAAGDVSWDTGSLADWVAVLPHGDYGLNRDGVLIERDPAPAAPAPADRAR